MSVYKNILWRTPGNEENGVAHTKKLQHSPKGFHSDVGHIWDLVEPNGECNRVAEIMMINFAESGHPTFQATSPLGRGELKSKSGGEKTIHYNGSEETIELILRTVISVNQRIFYGAVADLCNELDPDFAESEICESLVIPIECANADATSQSSTSSAQGNLLQDYFEKFAELVEGQKLSKLCKDAGFIKKIEKGQFFITIVAGPEVMQRAC